MIAINPNLCKILKFTTSVSSDWPTASGVPHPAPAFYRRIPWSLPYTVLSARNWLISLKSASWGGYFFIGQPSVLWPAHDSEGHILICADLSAITAIWGLWLAVKGHSWVTILSIFPPEAISRTQPETQTQNPADGQNLAAADYPCPYHHRQNPPTASAIITESLTIEIYISPKASHTPPQISSDPDLFPYPQMGFPTTFMAVSPSKHVTQLSASLLSYSHFWPPQLKIK